LVGVVEIDCIVHRAEVGQAIRITGLRQELGGIQREDDDDSKNRDDGDHHQKFDEGKS
jgi:hypothetical protein